MISGGYYIKQQVNILSQKSLNLLIFNLMIEKGVWSRVIGVYMTDVLFCNSCIYLDGGSLTRPQWAAVDAGFYFKQIRTRLIITHSFH